MASIPVIAGPPKAEVRINPRLSAIPEASASRKERSRSNSLESVSDEDLDRFHSDEEDDEPARVEKEAPMAQPMMATRCVKAEAPKCKSGAGGFFGAIASIFSGSKKGGAEGEEEKGRPKEKRQKDRVKCAMGRRGMAAPQNNAVHMAMPLSQATGSVGKRYEQEVDTNVLSLNMSVLKDKAQIATGDPVICGKCKAMFNIHSKLNKDLAISEQSWICEFCNNTNKVSIEEEEMPKADELTYVIESAQQAMVKKGGSEDTTMVFCVDVSGSMCVSQKVQDKMAFKYDKVKKMQDLMKFSDGSYQFLTGESAATTYISRMQCLQAAIEKQLNELANGAPKHKVGVVTFNNEVTLIGDGMQPPKVIAGDKLLDYEGLLETAQKDAETYVTKSIGDTKKGLIDRLGEIEESGQTALGPALLVALGTALKGTAGSRVIICTDGLANVGLGSVEDLSSEAAFNATKGFYTKIGELAKSKGVAISIISLVGDECRLEMLSPLADLTGGDIYKVDPVNLATDFANILSEAVIATNVEVRVKLHKGLTFRNEDVKNVSEDGTLLVKPIGNATDGQEVTLEYCAKPSKELKAMTDIDFSKVTTLPFQTQISYLSLDGMKCVRLITKSQEITFEKEEAKKDANYKVLSVNAIQQTAKMARGGEFRKAQANAWQWKKVMKGSEQYEDYMVNAAPLYDALEQQQAADMMEEAAAPMKSESQPMAKAKGKPKQRDYVVSEASHGQRMNFERMSKK